MINRNALSLIGNTPLLTLQRIYRGPGTLMAKAEFVQPGGSVKDRAAKKIIDYAYDLGALYLGKPVVEMTSGNMGAGLAVVCAVKGNPFVAVMSSGNSSERVKMLRGLGAEVILVPQVTGSPGQVTGDDIAVAAEEAKRIAIDRNAYYVDQFNNPGSLRAHIESTGPEIWSDTEGKITAFVAAVGSSGTFTGTSKYLKSQNSKVQCFAVEPQGAAVLAGHAMSKPKHLLQGIGYGSVPPHWDASLADGIIEVSDEEATLYRKLLAEKEGLFVGYSAAANVAATVKILESNSLGDSPIIVTVLCDTGLKY
ncbi:MAG: cysteine synthase family protein [Bdellovibrionota bacterium]